MKNGCNCLKKKSSARIDRRHDKTQENILESIETLQISRQKTEIVFYYEIYSNQAPE